MATIADRYGDDGNFFLAAWAHWDADRALRDRYAEIDVVLNSEHDLNVPESVAGSGRVEPVYSGRAAEQLDRAKGLLMDPRGLLITAVRPGTSNKAEALAEDVQEWLTAMVELLRERGEGDLIEDLTEDILKRARAAARVGVELDIPADLADLTPEELAAQGYVPITADWVPAEGVIEFWDHSARGGADVVWEFQERLVPDVLEMFRDADGEPLAKDLAAQWHDRTAGMEPVLSDTVTVIIRTDRTHQQIAVSSRALGGGLAAGPGGTTGALEEIIWEGEHGFGGRVPYALFAGRQRAVRRRDRRGYGFLDEMAPVLRLYDQALTQHHFGARYATWMTQYIKRHHLAEPVNTGDRPPQLEMKEAGVFTGLLPGEEILPVRFSDPADWAILNQDVGKFEQLIELHGLPSTLSGAGPAGASGYALNLRNSAGALGLERFEAGLAKGFAQLCRLLLRAAKVLIDAGRDRILVRHVAEDAGASYVTLSGKHVGAAGEPFIDWDIQVTVKSRPPEGDAALMQTLAIEKQNNWGSDLERERRLGNRAPLRSMERRLQEAILNRPEIIDAVAKSVSAAYLEELTKRALPESAEGGAIPQALADALGKSGGLGARSALGDLPESPPGPAGPENGMGPGYEGAPGPLGGTPPGMAQQVPGGLDRLAPAVGAPPA